MKRRWLIGILGTIGGVVLLVVLGLLWVLNTQIGTRAALNLAQRVVGEKLHIDSSEGSIAGPLSLAGLRYTDPVSGLDVTVKQVRLDPALLELFRMRIHVVDAEVHGLDVVLGESAEPSTEPEPSEPFTLDAPIDLVVERFALRDAVIRRADAEVVRIDSADFVGSWIDTNVAIQQLDVGSPDGEIHFAGEVAGADTYVGNGS